MNQRPPSRHLHDRNQRTPEVVMEHEAPWPTLPAVRTVVVACPWCGVVGNHDPICREAR